SPSRSIWTAAAAACTCSARETSFRSGRAKSGRSRWAVGARPHRADSLLASARFAQTSLALPQNLRFQPASAIENPAKAPRHAPCDADRAFRRSHMRPALTVSATERRSPHLCMAVLLLGALACAGPAGKEG